MKLLHAWLFAAALLCASAAAAQQAPAPLAASDPGGSAALPPVATLITPDIDPTRSLGTIVTPAGAVQIIDGGTRAGSNLFHSFAQFDLARGDTARFVHSAGNPASIANVVSRVTGGAASHIDGTIDSTALPNADFWFINPAGILFGEGASLNVPAAAHFSTAQELRFASGPAFAVTTPGGSTLSVAAPESFGFLGGQGDIEVRNGNANLGTPGGNLSFSGANVSFSGATVEVGGLAAVAVGNGTSSFSPSAPLAEPRSGTLTIADGSELIATREAGMQFGGNRIIVEDSAITHRIAASLPQLATISIVGGNLDMNRSSILAFALGGGRAAEIQIGASEINLTDVSIIDDATASGNSAEIGIVADRLRMTRSLVSVATLNDASGALMFFVDEASLVDSTISSDTFGAGFGGLMMLLTHALTLDNSVISSSGRAGSTGDGGNILLFGESLVLDRGSRISAGTSGEGNGGRVQLFATTYRLDRGSRIESRSEAGAGGDAGRIFLGGNDMVLDRGSSIRSDTQGAGNAGVIGIGVENVALRGGSSISTESLSECPAAPCGAAGAAGAIQISARHLSLTNGAQPESLTSVSSSTRGNGAAGAIELHVESLEMGADSMLSSETFGQGRGGTVTIDADTIAMNGLALISTGTFGPGAGGSIEIDARSVRIENQARIAAQSSFLDSGTGGSIIIRADDVLLRNEAELNTTSFGSGDAGSILVEAKRLEVDRNSLIGTDSLASGNGGAIRLIAGDLLVTNGSAIAADALGSCAGPDCGPAGNAGSIVIHADRFTLSGAVDPFGNDLTSQVSSLTFSSGNAGSVSVTTGEMRLDRGMISSGTLAAGDAGSVTIDAGSLSLTNRSQITTSSTPPCVDGCPVAGDAGAVTIVASGAIALDRGSEISSSTAGPGDAGRIDIHAASLSLSGASISTSSAAGAEGRSGTIGIEAGEVVLAAGGSIETISRNTRPAGGIAIAADMVSVVGPGARISSANESESGGDAGSAEIAARNLLVADGGEISTSSVSGAAGDIVITMPRDGLLRLEGAETPGVITTSSGPGTGGRIIIAAPRAIISNGGSILALGESGGANVQIQTMFFISSADRPNLVAVDGSFLLEAQVGDVSRGTVERDLSVIDASGVLRGQCAAVRQTGQVSQLVVRPVGPYAWPARPDPPRSDACG